MTSFRSRSLRSLIESKGGIHLSIYLSNDGGGLASMRSQLRECVDNAFDHLKPVLSTKEATRFLDPILTLMHDDELLKGLRENVGLFRTNSMFRVLALPVEVEATSVVANSFHVKPLLRWMQVDREFLLLCMSDQATSLHLGSQKSIQQIDSIPMTDKRTAIELTARRINYLTRDVKPRLFIAGEADDTTPMYAALKSRVPYANLHPTPILDHYLESSLDQATKIVRAILRQEARAALQSALMEFHHAEHLSLARKNLFQIAKAAIRGKIRKLIVADGVHIFGKINEKTGGLAIHPTDLDHEDDDLLDDLAQTVLEHGGEVIVAKKEEIPKGRPILAILGRPESEAHLNQREAANDPNRIQEPRAF